MASQAQRDTAARAVFVSTYENECEDDPEFPIRLWSQMSEESKSIYYRWADAALNVAAVTSDAPSP
jgi:hypothetical protein